MNVIPVFGTPTLSVEDVQFVIGNNREMKIWQLVQHLNAQPRAAEVKPHHLQSVLNKCKADCEETIVQCVSEGNPRQAAALLRFRDDCLPVKKLRQARPDALAFRCRPPLKTWKNASDDDSEP